MINVRPVLADDEGGIILGTEVINKYGKKFSVISNTKYITLIPIKKNSNTYSKTKTLK